MSLNGEISFPQLKNNILKKISICYYGTLNQSLEIYDNDPIFKLLSGYSDIENILKLNDRQITKFLYFNRKYVHQILYDADKTIHFNYEENNNNLSFYFYLILLINDMPDILNYTYDSKYIKVISEQQEKINNPYNKIIISKIIIELANDYKTANDCFNDENGKIINNIINMNLKIIQNIIETFTETEINLTKEKISEMKIDEIYIEIIIDLIKKKIIENYESSYNIIKQLNLENIDLTKLMFDKLSEFLNSNEEYINDYIITNIEDFSSEKKVNFYFILFKYILKNTNYIYKIPFLINTRKNIKKIIDLEGNISIQGNINIENKVEYLLKIFTNSDGHFQNKHIILNNCSDENNNNSYSLIKKEINKDNNQIEKEKIKSNELTKNEKNKNENLQGKKVENENLTQKSEKSMVSTQIEEKSKEDSKSSSSTELPLIPFSNFDLENITNSNIKFPFENSLDYIYFSYLLFSNPYFKQIFKEIINDPKKIDLFSKIYQNENDVDMKKILTSKEFKEILDKQNIFHLLIKEGLKVIDPYEEINYLENKLPYEANLKSVKLFSEFIEKEKK